MTFHCGAMWIDVMFGGFFPLFLSIVSIDLYSLVFQLWRYFIIVFWVAESEFLGLFGFDEFFIVVVAAVRNSDI